MRHNGAVIFIAMIAATLLLLATGCANRQGWRTARRDSAGIAPDPATTREAVLQVYAARAWGWRGWFAVHTWVSAKRTGEARYTVYQVIGWRLRRYASAVSIENDLPDRYWYDARPKLIKEHRGEGVDALIDAVDRAARAYPWAKTYRAFPGPNSNTFIAWIARRVPRLDLRLPLTAIGKGYGD